MPSEAMTRCLNLRTWQVRALQAGATQIRVPMRKQPHESTTSYIDAPENGDVWVPVCACCGANFDLSIRCPFPPGTLLVGRETWWRYKSSELEMAAWGTGGIRTLLLSGGTHDEPSKVINGKTWHPADYSSIWMKRSAATMPLWAARIRRTVTAARPQRVCEISEVDARACGVKPWYEADLRPDGELREGPSQKYRAGFHEQWYGDYGSRYPWESAWCWVVEVQQ